MKAMMVMVMMVVVMATVATFKIAMCQSGF